MATCSWVCHSDCGGEHHPLLIALFNAVDSDSLQQFKGTLSGFQVTGFNLQIKVPDPNPAFQHPLIHWAASLGKGNVLEMLQKPPFSMDMSFQSDDFETALHRSLLLWNAKEIPLSNAFAVIEQLQVCLDSRNAKLQTPLHICAVNLTKCVKQDFLFWKEVMNKMVTSIDDSNLVEVLNSQDVNGDSIIHILSTNGDVLDIIHSLLCCGANFNIMNYRKEKPIDIAWKYSIAVYNLYRVITTEIGLDEFYVDKNVRRTRTATGLSKPKNYKRFFDNSDDVSDDDDYVVVKRKGTSQAKLPSKTDQRKNEARRAAEEPEKSAISKKSDHKIHWEQKPGANEGIKETKRTNKHKSNTNEPPLHSSPQSHFNINLQNEMRLEDEISETIKSILVMYQDDSTEL